MGPGGGDPATVDLEAAAPPRRGSLAIAAPPDNDAPPPRRGGLAIDEPQEGGSPRSLASPAGPEMTVDQDARDVYGGFRRRFRLKKSRSTEPWSRPRKPRVPAIRRRIMRAWAHNYFWLFLVVLAVVTAVAAFVMDEAALGLREGLVDHVLRTGGSERDYGVALYVLLRVGITVLAVEMTRRVAPIAAGSGIPEVKAILAGFSLPGFLEPRTLVAKVLGVVLLLGAGLPIGKEGPFIHAAAIFAELLMRVPFFARHGNPLFRNQMLSAAAAVGVSAAFGADSSSFDVPSLLCGDGILCAQHSRRRSIDDVIPRRCAHRRHPLLDRGHVQLLRHVQLLGGLPLRHGRRLCVAGALPQVLRSLQSALRHHVLQALGGRPVPTVIGFVRHPGRTVRDALHGLRGVAKTMRFF